MSQGYLKVKMKGNHIYFGNLYVGKLLSKQCNTDNFEM